MKALCSAALAALTALTACSDSAPDAAPTATPAPATVEAATLGAIARAHTAGDLWLTSQPSAADFEAAAALGLATVIDQRKPDEDRGFDEQAAVEGLGLAYHNPHFKGSEELTEAVIDETLELMRTAQRPALMHCGSANRTGALWLAYRTTVDGLEWDAALAEATEVGLRSPDYQEVVRAYVER